MNKISIIAILVVFAIGVGGGVGVSHLWLQPSRDGGAGAGEAEHEGHADDEGLAEHNDPVQPAPDDLHSEGVSDDEHAVVDEHAGHDHGSEDAAVDEQAGHDDSSADAVVDEQAGHDDSDADAVVDEHAGHDHGSADAGDDQSANRPGGGTVVRFSAEQRKEFGIGLATAGAGTLITEISLPGEIVLNADRVAHIVPLAPGIVQEVLKRVGDTVTAGEVMAWIESSELGEAKVHYLAKWAEVGCCAIDLSRAQEVHDNTTKLIEVLKTSPSMDALRAMDGVAMGENRSTLVAAHAEYAFAKAAYEREKPLLEKKVASEKDYQEAEATYKKADALYTATCDSVGFKVWRDLQEAKRVQQVREMELRGAERRLYVLGLRSEDVQVLAQLAQSRSSLAGPEEACSDPNCKDCAKHKPEGPAVRGPEPREVNVRLAWYPLLAPFDGIVIEKHLTLGEKPGDDSAVFTIVDLSSVWVDISVYQKDLPYVRKGQTVHISASGAPLTAEGTVAFLAPLVDEKTRTALARVVLENPNGEWRPGLFVIATIALGAERGAVVVPKTAVQRLEAGPVVFVDTNEGLEPTPVSLGRSDATRVEILAGLTPGQRYVARGAFELKAKIITSGLGAHAGHGH